MKAPILVILSGLLALLIGTIFGGVLVDQSATTGADAQMGSFATAKTFNDLLPMIFFIALMIIGIGLMVGGGYSAYKRVKS